MKPSYCMKLVVKSLALVSMLGSLAWAQGGPIEQTSQFITRTSASPLTMHVALSKNIYRQEAYQSEYPVQVPYQVQEAYTDHETYYETERRCYTRYENECRQEQICENVSRPQCRQERVCSPVPSRPSCRRVTECGTNARGERICKEREVCDGSGGGGQRCDYVERCDHRTERQCRYENRCRQVPRQECRNEQVARTRPVTRYRTVTKYRTEMRCCQTSYRNVFDRQEQIQVQLRFNPGSELQAGEVEQLQVSLIGDGSQPLSVAVRTLTNLYSYRILGQSNQGGLIVVDLLQVEAEYADPEIGEMSVDSVKLKIREDESAFVVFNDNGQRPRIVTVYEVVVRDDSGRLRVSEQFSATGIVAQKLELSQRLSLRQGHTLELRVSRSGQGIPGSGISFMKAFYRPR